MNSAAPSLALVDTPTAVANRAIRLIILKKEFPTRRLMTIVRQSNLGNYAYQTAYDEKEFSPTRHFIGLVDPSTGLGALVAPSPSKSEWPTLNDKDTHQYLHIVAWDWASMEPIKGSLPGEVRELAHRLADWIESQLQYAIP